MADQVKTIRASETISPYGPGAIVDILGQSFMVPTGDQWPPAKLRRAVASDRLADALNVDELWAAPTTHSPEDRKTPGLEFERFPGWLFCQVCRRMVQWRRQMETGAVPSCQSDSCDGRLVPMRFVAVCTTSSHISDVPWVEWLHRSRADGPCASPDRLRFESSEGRAEGLSSLQVRCENCGHRRSLGELRKDVLVKEGFTCRGKQPWERDWGNCGKPIDPQQRGATSLHFSDVMSAIDIPAVDSRDDEDRERIHAHGFFSAMRIAADDSLRQTLAAQISSDTGVPLDVVLRVGAEVDGTIDVRATRSSLQSDEYEAFIAAIAGTNPNEGFNTRVARLPAANGNAADGLAALITDVVLVDRLRDVRAVVGFRRYTPDADLVSAVRVAAHEKKWLPAVEGYGEGVFLRFNADAVAQWAAQDIVGERGRLFEQNQASSLLGSRLHAASSEYVMLHTFSHLLMRELTFSSGYSSASIRERVYCEADGDYGVFVYTTSSDVEGTLGGLVRQGEPDLLAESIVRALQASAWCPNDPVCIESEPQSIDGLNLAACHACCLASETSCESQNLLLDRALVVGTDDVRGYFGPVLDAVLGQRAATSGHEGN